MSGRPWSAGPWCVIRIPGLYRRIAPAWDTRAVIATLPGVTTPRLLADATLIAAAPELYEALDVVLEHVVPDNWEKDEDMAIAVRQLMLAMSKARGES